MLAKIFELIGIRGIIIIVLALIIGAETLTIKANRKKITLLNETIVSKDVTIKGLKENINTQNAAITEFEKYKKELDDRLKKNADKIVELNKQNAALKGKLEKMPLAVNCIDAMTELKTQSGVAVQNWNKK